MMTEKVRRYIINTIEPPYFYNLQPYGLSLSEVKGIMEELFYNKQKHIEVQFVFTRHGKEDGYIEVFQSLPNDDNSCIEFYYEEFPECQWRRQNFFANGYKVFSTDGNWVYENDYVD